MATGWTDGERVSGPGRGRTRLMQLGGIGLIVVVLWVVAVQSLQSCTAFDLDFGTDPGKGDKSRRLAVQVTPHTGLRPGQKVQVSSSAFASAGMVDVAVCLREADTKRRGVDACDTVQGSQFETDGRGRLAVTYRIPRVITVGERPYDCAVRADRCLLVAADKLNYDNSGGQPLRFRRGLPPVDLVAKTERPRSLKLRAVVRPSGPLRAGRTIVVDAYGFSPGEPLMTGWCTAAYERKGIDACDPSDFFNGSTPQADQEGHVRLRREVPSAIDPFGTDEATVTCSTRPGACQFGVAASADYQRSALVPVTVRR